MQLVLTWLPPRAHDAGGPPVAHVNDVTTQALQTLPTSRATATASEESRRCIIENATLAGWHDLVRRRDSAGLDDLLADDVLFHSPVVHTPKCGKQVTQHILAAAFRVLSNPSFRYVREIAGKHDAVLEFMVEIDGISVNGVDMIKWNDEGRIVEVKVMLRPLKAVNIIHQKMAEMLAERQ